MTYHPFLPEAIARAMDGAFTRAFDKAAFNSDNTPAPEQSPPIGPVFKTNAIAMNISRDMALDYGLVEPTPEEKVRRDAEMASWQETKRAGYQQTLTYTAALDAITDPVARLVLDHHTTTRLDYFLECKGCDPGSHAEDGPDWPCTTVDLIADHYGIQKPIYVTFQEPK